MGLLLFFPGGLGAEAPVEVRRALLDMANLRFRRIQSAPRHILARRLDQPVVASVGSAGTRIVRIREPGPRIAEARLWKRVEQPVPPATERLAWRPPVFVQPPPPPQLAPFLPRKLEQPAAVETRPPVNYSSRQPRDLAPAKLVVINVGRPIGDAATENRRPRLAGYGWQPRMKRGSSAIFRRVEQPTVVTECRRNVMVQFHRARMDYRGMRS